MYRSNPPTPRSCLVLGSGRSGTSMVTGTLARAGYVMGDQLYPPRTANPRGFFEDPEINGINEALLAAVVPATEALGENQRWLAALPSDVALPCPPALDARIRRATARRPFCYKDPRFSHTLPAWRPHLGDAGLVCVFRDPLVTVRSVVKEVGTAAYLRGVPFDEARAFALWCSTYRALLRRHRHEGDWLFVHYDQVLRPDGRARLGRFLGVEPDGAFPDPLLHRARPEGEVPAEAAELYAELCALAGHEEARPGVAEPGVDVSVVVVVEPGDRVEALLDAFADQRQVRAELILVDTRETPEEAPRARVVPLPTWSRGRALRAGVEAARGRLVATWRPGVNPLPSQLAHAVRALDAHPAAVVAVADGWVSRPPESFVTRVEPVASGFASAAWTGAAVWRRDALATVPTEAFFPVERALVEVARTTAAVIPVSEPGFHVDEAVAARMEEEGRAERALLESWRRPHAGPPRISVVVCTWNRQGVLRECLAAFARQAMARGSYELVVVDDGSTDTTPDRLGGLELAVPLTTVRQDNAGLAAARNTGIGVATGRYLHLVNDDTIPRPDCVAEHLAAHDAHPGQDLAVLGTFEQPAEALDHALMRHCESGQLVFCYSELHAGRLHEPRYFYTCNVSVSAARVREAGGFDPAFRHYGGEDTDLGLRMGLPVLYHPAARALHRHTWGYDYLARRNPLVARAHVRLFLRHPDLIDVFRVHEETVASLGAGLARRAPLDAGLDAAARGLAALDVGAIERLGPNWKPYAEETERRLGAVLAERNRGWWSAGFLAGLREHGLSGFPELLARHPLRFDVPGEAALVFPARDGDWRGVVARFAAARPEGLTLVVVVPPRDVEAVTRLIGEPPGVAVAGFGRPPGHQVRLLAGARAWVPTGSVRDGRLRSLAAWTDCEEVDPSAWVVVDQGPWPLAAQGRFRLLAWPRWDDPAALEELLGRFGPTLAGEGTLVLRLDPSRDGPTQLGLARLGAAAERVIPEVDLEVLLVDDPMGEDDLGRLLRAVDAVASPGPLVHPHLVRDPRELGALIEAARAA